MSEPVLPLGGASFEGTVGVREAPARGMITIRGDLGAMSTALGAAGLVVPTPLSVADAGARSLAWMSPDELLALCPDAEVGALVADLRQALAGQHALVADVSDARACFVLEGADPRAVLAKLVPTDLAALTPGAFRRSRLAQVPAALWMREATVVEVLCFRSVAQYAFDVLCSAARPAQGMST